MYAKYTSKKTKARILSACKFVEVYGRSRIAVP